MTLPIYTLDIETDPFQHGRLPKAFAVGLYNGVDYWHWWGKDCIEQAMLHVENMERAIVYAHNGGRFDFFFLMHWMLGQKMNIKNSRIIMSEVDSIYGKHEFRDSFAIMPFALGKFKGKEKKGEIEIGKLEAKRRAKYKDEILAYLKQDCVVLWSLVSVFAENFGRKTLTIGSASMRELKKLHKFDALEEADDADIRKHYYYGGRVECFDKGIIKGNFKVYDVNSMYPFAMQRFEHPIGRPSHEGREIEQSTMLLSVEGHNRGAFPMVVKGKIMFDVPYGVFHVTRHEYDAAIDCGLFDLVSVHRAISFANRTANFSDFVYKFYNARIEARENEDEIMALFYKFILNSAYGKFGQNPDNYKEYMITDNKSAPPVSWVEIAPGKYEERNDWQMDTLEHGDNYIVWSKPATDTSRFNVATGASITGAARSILLRAIADSRRPLYCDTDSILCEELPLAKKDHTALGAWKLEAECDLAAIAGRKLYSLWQKGKCVKQANKGVAITAEQIKDVCKGIPVESLRDAPSFKLDGSHRFISRRVRMT